MAIRIPPQHEKTFKRLLAMTPDEHQRLVHSLRKAKPTLEIEELVPAVVASTGMESNVVDDMLEALASMYYVSTVLGKPVFEFVKDALDDLRDRQGFEPADGDWVAFERRLNELLSLDQALGISAKASSLLMQQQRSYNSAQVITDLRPVFGEDVATGPTCMTVVHSMKIAFFEGTETREFFVAMDSEDLRELKVALERALAKERSLQSTLSKAGIQHLDIKSKQD